MTYDPTMRDSRTDEEREQDERLQRYEVLVELAGGHERRALILQETIGEG